MPYNGWTNHATWNVALWIGNDEGLYRLAKHTTRRVIGDGSPYKALVEELRELGTVETPDRVSYSDSGLDIDELDQMMREL